MPEGHTVHRSARQLAAHLGGVPLRATSPQGRFAAGAAAVDGMVMDRAEAWGKHLLLRFDAPRGSDRYLHVHLGLYGTWLLGTGTPPEPKGALRLRLLGPGEEPSWADLRGPTACELMDDVGRAALLARLGPDPLRPDADPGRAWDRVHRSRQPVAALLMDQSVLAGVGNVYRAEVLFRAGLAPMLPGSALPEEAWQHLWDDLVVLMRAGVRAGHIVTTERRHRERVSGQARREDRFYVYRRHGLPCRLCGTPVQVAELVGRRLYWCPACQTPEAGGVARAVARDCAGRRSA
jgi:formamidopyrimidine-DNA glycosylase